jgi:hypothetical protein
MRCILPLSLCPHLINFLTLLYQNKLQIKPFRSETRRCEWDKIFIPYPNVLDPITQFFHLVGFLL